MSAPVASGAVEWHHGPPKSKTPQAATPAEKIVADFLADAWQAYLDLRNAEGGSDDDLADFRRAIDQCHMLVSHRLAARVDPSIWC